MDYDYVSKVIDEARGKAVDFGDANSVLVPSEVRIGETESLLEQKLPASYLWFLRNYGGGTIFGDQIFSIFGEYSNQNMMDVAARTLSDRKNGFIDANEISICFTDFGEQFLLDASANGLEYPVIRKTGGLRKVVAENFAEFLVSMIREDIS